MSAATRAKIGDALRGKPKSPEHLESLRLVQQTPEWKAKWLASRRGKTTMSAAARVKIGDALRGKPKSAEHREKLARWSRSPEGRAHWAELRDAWVKTPEGAAQAFRSYRSMGFFAEFGAFLRDQDGDLCQLCLEPIDFTLPLRTPWSRSVDHIVPIRGAGADDLSNFWLAHLVCNQSKGARWVGRKDGTTDVRERVASPL